MAIPLESPPQACPEEQLNRLPATFRHVHLMGICGTGMASLAGMLQQLGYRVSGSDQNVYPPMSTLLAGLGIPVASGYGPRNLHPLPDLVIVGNVITRLNPEAVEMVRLGIPYLSFPQAIRHLALQDRRPLVVAGTHGKTTTASLLSWVLETAGKAPGFMIGGIPLNFQRNFSLGHGPYFAIEGDEYDTAFFDKGPKFLHYAPWAAILTSIEFDHADIYRDLDHVIQSFRRFIRLLPPEGCLVANADSTTVVSEAQGAPCPLITYGMAGRALWQGRVLERCAGLTRVGISVQGRPWAEMQTPLYGRHNIANALAVIALADRLGIDRQAVHEGLRTFKGVKRRQEWVGQARDITILDDFAHHPTAVRETLAAVREAHPGQRIIAVFEPRSNSSRRNIFQALYPGAFRAADWVLIPEPPLMEKIPVGERFSSQRLTDDIAALGIAARYCATTDEVLEQLCSGARGGDVVLFMSNGGFDNLPQRLLQALQSPARDRFDPRTVPGMMAAQKVKNQTAL